MTDPAPGDIPRLFAPGQQVQVHRDGVYQYTGTVVGYTRCGCFRVREPDNGGIPTVCDYHYTELAPA